jgi:hypothetical protein
MLKNIEIIKFPSLAVFFSFEYLFKDKDDVIAAKKKTKFSALTKNFPFTIYPNIVSNLVNLP